MATRALESSLSAVVGLFQRGFSTAAAMETAQLQFKTLLGDADAAREKIAELFQITKETPFEFAGVTEASRSLQSFGGSLLNTRENILLVGDAAAANSAQLERVAFWYGRAYAAIQGGRPFGEAAQNLQELAVLSAEGRTRIERLTEAGASSERVWAALQAEFGRFSGAMKEQSLTWQGLTSTAQDSINLMSATVFAPLFEEAKRQLATFNALLETDDAEQWGKNLATVMRDDVVPSVQAAARDIATLAGFIRDVKTAIDSLPKVPIPTPEGQAPKDLEVSRISLLGNLDILTEDIRQMAGFAEEEFRQSKEAADAFYEVLTVTIPDAVNRLFTQRDFAAEARAKLGPVRDDWRITGIEVAAAIDTMADAIEDGVDDIEALGIADRLLAAFDLADAQSALGDGGAELVKALTDSIELEGEKDLAKVAAASRKIMDRWLKELDLTEAERRGAALRAALVRGAAGEGTGEAEGLLTDFADTDRQRQLAERAQRDAERRQREANAAARDAEREAERQAREAANVPIVGFLEAAAANRTNLLAQFGELGAGAAGALSDAFRERTAASGSAAFREMDRLIDTARRDGLPNWREAGDDFAATFLFALGEGLGNEQARQAALAKLDEFASAIRAHRGLSPENFAASFDAAALRAQLGAGGASVMDALRTSFEEGGEAARQTLARQAVSWIQEVRRGLSPSEADAAISDFMAAMTLAAEGSRGEAEQALQGLFTNVTLRIPQAAIDLMLEESLSRIEETRQRSEQDAETNRQTAQAIAQRQAALTAQQRADLDRLQLSFVDPAAGIDTLPTGLNARAAEIRVLSERAQISLRREREDIDRALGILREAEDREDARQNRDRPGILTSDLQRMSQAERDVAIRRLNDQVAAESRREAVEQAALDKRRAREQQDLDTRRGREQQDLDRRINQEAQLAALRDSQAGETERLRSALDQEAFDRQLQNLRARAAEDEVKAQAKHAADTQRLSEQQALLETMRLVADRVYDGMLVDLERAVEQTQTMAAALQQVLPGGIGTPGIGTLGAATPAAVVESKTINGPLFSFINHGDIGSSGDAEDTVAAVARAGLAQIAASGIV